MHRRSHILEYPFMMPRDKPLACAMCHTVAPESHEDKPLVCDVCHTTTPESHEDKPLACGVCDTMAPESHELSVHGPLVFSD